MCEMVEPETHTTNKGNLFLRLGEAGQRTMTGLLCGNDVARLDTAMSDKAGRAALLRIFKGLDVYGGTYYMTLPAFREDDKYDGVDELAVGLQWMEKKGIVAREWTLNMDNDDYRFPGDHILGLISRQRRAMFFLTMERCLKSVDLNYILGMGLNPVMGAAYLGELEMLEALCKRKDVVIDLLNEEGWTALHMTAGGNRTECMQILLDQGGANIDAVTRDDNSTALHYSVERENIVAVSILVERGANLNIRDISGETALDLADRLEDRAEFAAYIEMKGGKRSAELPWEVVVPTPVAGNPDFIGPLPMNKFLKLSEENRQHMLSYLSIYDIMSLDYAMKNHLGRPALLEAMQGLVCTGPQIRYKLPACRPDMNYEHLERLAPALMWTEMRGMIVRDFTFGTFDEPGIEKPSAHLALVSRKRRGMMKMILNRCPNSFNMNVMDPTGLTALSGWVYLGDTEMVRLLCEKDSIDVEVGRRKPLHVAASEHQLECMQILLDVGKAEVNSRTNIAQTPLHIVVCKGHVDTATLLVERGADINALDMMGHTPLDNAEERKHNSMVDFLKSKGAMKRESRPSDDDTSGDSEED